MRLTVHDVDPGDRIGDQRRVALTVSDPDAFLKALGRSIAAARAERRMPQRELADAAGVALSTISRVEAGKFNPTVTTLAAIGAALGLGLDELAGIEVRPREAPVDRSLSERFDQLALEMAGALEEAQRAREDFAALVDILANEPALPAQLRTQLQLVLGSRGL